MNTRGPSTYDPARERVYLDFYNLDEAPFSITPDPEYLFYSVTHQNAINKLLYGINSRMGFLLLVGEAGTGKTTICRSLLDNLETDKEKLLQIILVGQPELLTQLSRPEIRQLQQRVALTCRLDFLSRSEVEEYISRRLFISGDKGHIRSVLLYDDSGS